MFGMGFSELLVIAVIAILFLGPDKLPSTMVEIAKFFRSMKQTVNSVKESINEEIHIEDIKKEAESYKQQLLEAQTKVNSTVNLSSLDDEINSLIDDDEEKPKPKSDKAIKATYEEPTFTKKTKTEENLEKENKDV
ncbi:MAG: Sec-independent protein translocase subunit TatB [Epsilonproteobacteria bacterium]|nr:Sec-independent protein translocase subunit TatB [Campylobacterota bacterium]